MKFVEVVGNYSSHAVVRCHPDGTTFLGYQHITYDADRKALRAFEIWKLTLGGELSLVKAYHEHVDAPGPFGLCSFDLRSDGAIMVGICCERSTDPDIDNVQGGYEILVGACAPYKSTIRDWIYEVIGEAIAYARDHTRVQSRLRALIEDIAKAVK